MKKASDYINEIFDSIQIDEHTHQISLFQSWEKIAGSDIAAHSKIHELEGKTLVISVDHPGWIQMIDLQKRRILRKISAQYPELGIERLYPRLG